MAYSNPIAPNNPFNPTNLSNQYASMGNSFSPTQNSQGGLGALSSFLTPNLGGNTTTSGGSSLTNYAPTQPNTINQFSDVSSLYGLIGNQSIVAGNSEDQLEQELLDLIAEMEALQAGRTVRTLEDLLYQNDLAGVEMPLPRSGAYYFYGY